ncbi:MAG: hypothetical protein VKO44_05595 [Cyanobacteriota bacterium]|nr:hypothetical protein [Cyanobacteriota bacterium]
MPKPFPCRIASLPGLLSLGLLFGLASPALAQPVGPEGRGDRLTPEQRQRLFPEQRRLALQDHQARIAILQRGQGCLTSAASADDLRGCMRAEREAMRQQRRQFMLGMKEMYERNGLPAPQWRQRLERPRGGAGSSGGGPTGRPAAEI